MDGPTYLCKDHFADPYLKALVRFEIDRIGLVGPPCTVCSGRGLGQRGADLDVIVEVVEEALRRFYIDGDGWWEGPIDVKAIGLSGQLGWHEP